MKGRISLFALGVALPLMSNADCLEPLNTFNDVGFLTNEIGCETGSFWGCAGHGKYMNDGTIKVMTPTDTWSQDLSPHPVRAVQACLYPNGIGGYNALESVEYDGGPIYNLMSCSSSRIVGTMWTSDTFGYYSDAALWIVDPNDPLYDISNGNPVNLNDLIAPIDLPPDPSGFQRKLVRADDVRGNDVLVWATSASQPNDVGGFYESRHAMLMTMNLDECTGSPPPPPDVVVPNFIGMTRAAAEAQILNLGLTTGTITEVHNAQPVGLVYGQSPVNGTEVALGSPVDLQVSLGPDIGSGPTLISVHQEAENFIAQFGVEIERGTPASGGSNIGYIREGDWSQYLIQLFTADNGFCSVADQILDHMYTLRIAYAVWSTSGQRSVTVWDTYSGITTDVNLPVTDTSTVHGYRVIEVPFQIISNSNECGRTEIRLNYHGGSMNMDYIELIP